MIFVTVGTHEQPFNRLIRKVDELVRDGEIKDEVFMQIGYSTYEPKHTKWARIIGYSDMIDYLDKAEVVITHGGPSTYMQVLQQGKIPIVVPRQEKFDEHINDHQLSVSKQVIRKGYPILVCENIEELINYINNSKDISSDNIKSNNGNFVLNLKKQIESLVNDERK